MEYEIIVEMQKVKEAKDSLTYHPIEFYLKLHHRSTSSDCSRISADNNWMPQLASLS
jgi:hypothetical protein